MASERLDNCGDAHCQPLGGLGLVKSDVVTNLTQSLAGFRRPLDT